MFDAREMDGADEQEIENLNTLTSLEELWLGKNKITEMKVHTPIDRIADGLSSRYRTSTTYPISASSPSKQTASPASPAYHPSPTWKNSTSRTTPSQTSRVSNTTPNSASSTSPTTRSLNSSTYRTSPSWKSSGRRITSWPASTRSNGNCAIRRICRRFTLRETRCRVAGQLFIGIKSAWRFRISRRLMLVCTSFRVVDDADLIAFVRVG